MTICTIAHICCRLHSHNPISKPYYIGTENALCSFYNFFPDSATIERINLEFYYFLRNKIVQFFLQKNKIIILKAKK